MKEYSFWYANLKKGWKRVNLWIWKTTEGSMGLNKTDLRVKSEKWSELWVK